MNAHGMYNTVHTHGMYNIYINKFIMKNYSSQAPRIELVTFQTEVRLHS